MQKLASILMILGLAFTAFADETPPIIGGPKGTTLAGLVNTSTLVTVVLKNSGAADPNLRVIDVGPNYVAVVKPEPGSERTAYMFASIQEIRVQDGAVETKKLNIEDSRSLRAEEQRVIGRAFERATEIFGMAKADQSLKMKAAMIMVLNEDKAALEYLQKLAASNDLPTALDAVYWLHLAGQTDLETSVISMGLDSGNRTLRAKAATLAGLMGEKSAVPALETMLNDRKAELCAPAAIALARLDYRDDLNTMISMAIELNEAKGEAAITALSILGGADVVSKVKGQLDQTSGIARYRLVQVLYNLRDPQGQTLYTKEIFETPTLTPTAALTLAADNNFDAVQYLRRRLKERYNETDENMIYRAKAAAALIEGGDLTAPSNLQELLRSDKTEVKKKICGLMAELGKRRLIPLTQPVLESTEPDLALEACVAALAMAKPSFCERIQKVEN